MANTVILTLGVVTGWEDNDVSALEKWINAYANLLGEGGKERALQCTKIALALDKGFPCTDINDWFHAVLMLIFSELMSQLKESGKIKDTNLLKQLQTVFRPEIDYAQSCFDNFADSVDFEQDRKDIVEQVVSMLNATD